MKNIVLGVCGGIAAYKALDVTSGLKKLGYDVHVIMTKSAQEFVKPLSFQSLSANEVNTELFKEPATFDIKHISLAKKVDLLLVVPATANIIGKVANGIADDMLSTTIMATKAPVIFAPAMNTVMYNNRIYQKNTEYLKSLGYDFIPSAHGHLACGDIGEGKLPNTEDIIEYADGFLKSKKDLKGKNILVTAGATKSLIDPVRYITNLSSGKMGYAIAKEARNRGANVTLVSGETSLPPITGIQTIVVKSNEAMKNEIYKLYDHTDIVVMAAAVLDYKVKNYSVEKIKKNSDSLTIELEKDTDILYTLGTMKKNQVLIGFAAESNHVIENAKEKLTRKNLDYVIANDITLKNSGFDSDYNTISIISKHNDIVELEKNDKNSLAKKIFDTISL